MNPETIVASKLWPELAEMCSPEDWSLLEDAIKTNSAPQDTVVVPAGEAKDGVLATLLVLYWTMKLAKLALEISKQVKDLHGQKRLRAILDAIDARVSSDTPSSVASRVQEIVKAVDAES